MRIPTDHELGQLAHLYDPIKAHEYYLRTRKLKGRQKAAVEPPKKSVSTRLPPQSSAKARQRRELSERIRSLSSKLQQLEARIREMERKEASEDRKSKAKQERAAKERDKPKTAAEKAEAAREAKKYRDKNQQKLSTERKTQDRKTSDSKQSGGGSSGKKSEKSASLSDLKSLATKVRGQIAVAKQKLKALK